MKNTQKKLKKNITNQSISAEDVFGHFSVEQEKIVESEIRYYDVVKALKTLRQKLGLTQEQLAQKADVPRTTITKIESGSYNPTLATLMTLALAMNKRLQIQFI